MALFPLQVVLLTLPAAFGFVLLWWASGCHVVPTDGIYVRIVTVLSSLSFCSRFAWWTSGRHVPTDGIYVRNVAVFLFGAMFRIVTNTPSEQHVVV